VLVDHFLAEDHGSNDAHIQGMILQEDGDREREDKHRVNAWDDTQEKAEPINNGREHPYEKERNAEQVSIEEMVVFYLGIQVARSDLVRNGDEYADAEREHEEFANVWDKPDEDLEQREQRERHPVLLVTIPSQRKDLPDIDLVILRKDVVLEILGVQFDAHGKGDGRELSKLLLIVKLSI